MTEFDDLVYDSNGEPLGFHGEATDGARVIVGLDGKVLAAMTDDGVELDPDDYETLEETEPGYAEPDHELDQRLTALELRQQIDELKQQMIVDGIVPDPNQPTGDELAAELTRLQDDVGHQVDRLQRELGRDLTLREVQAVGEQIAAEAKNGRDPDVNGAYWSASIAGEIPTYDTAKHQDRVDLAMERLADQEEPREMPDNYDLDSRDERVQFMADRLGGLTGPLEPKETAA